MRNTVCDMLGIDFPLFAFSHCRDVVAAVSKAGGFGVFGASNGHMTVEQLKIELDWIDAHCGGRPYGLDLAVPENMKDLDATHVTTDQLKAQIPQQHKDFVEKLLVAHGVNTDTPVAADEDHEISHFHDTARLMVEEGLRHPIKLLVNALGVPPEFMVELAKAKGVRIGALVGSKNHARRQIDAGVEILVAQGTEAAAHCGEVTSMVLTPEVVSVARPLGVPVLTAGGVATGKQMAAAMMMGADGVWTGSVWLTTNESDVTEPVRQALLGAQSRDTLRSRAMTGKTARQLKSAWNAAWESPDSPGALPMPFQHLLTDRAFQQAEKSVIGGNEKARALVTEGVGMAIGLVHEQKSARQVVQEFMEDFAEATDRFKSMTDG